MIRNKKSKKRTPIVHTDDCEMLVAPKGPHLGLWCQTHRCCVQWIKKQHEPELRKLDIAWLNQAPEWSYKKSKNKTLT